MRNHDAAVTRRLSDPDFQASLITRCIGLAIAMSAIAVVAVIHDAWSWANRVPPPLYIVDGKNLPRQVVGLDSPIVDDTELLEWSVKAILAPYNVDYLNFPAQLNAASRRFTLNGWNTFANSYTGTGNFDEMRRARLLCHAQSQRAAVIHQTSYKEGALAYEVQVPIMQTCENVNQTSANNLLITASVLRINSDDHPDGLVVNQLVAAPH